MALESYCAACTYLGENADYNGKYYCSKKGDVYACDPKCYSFCEAYGRSNSARENMYDNSQKHQSSGCYLTTTMCNILNYPDDNYYLQTLRMFRDSILKTNINYIPLLLTYDIIGPQIADNLKQDKDNKIIATTLFTDYIKRAVDAIENNKIQEAVNIYIAMTTSLAERYNINTHILYIEPKSINLETLDTTTLGHGRIKRKLLITKIKVNQKFTFLITPINLQFKFTNKQ